jgi:hypothetical protein
MFPRDDDDLPRDRGDGLNVTTQIVVGSFVVFAFCALIWLIFRGF